MSSSKKRSRLLRRDGFLCGTHLGGCGKRIESIRGATVDHIFTQSFFREFEAPAETAKRLDRLQRPDLGMCTTKMFASACNTF